MNFFIDAFSSLIFCSFIFHLSSSPGSCFLDVGVGFAISSSIRFSQLFLRFLFDLLFSPPLGCLCLFCLRLWVVCVYFVFAFWAAAPEERCPFVRLAVLLIFFLSLGCLCLFCLRLLGSCLRGKMSIRPFGCLVDLISVFGLFVSIFFSLFTLWMFAIVKF